MTGPMPFPNIDPVAFELGPIVIRWYALAYLTGLTGGWLLLRRMVPRWPGLGALTREDVDDFLLWATFGVVLGGRLGYVLFYKPGYYLSNPLEIVQVWHGGMSFHGGLLGVAVAIWLFARKRKVPLLPFADTIAVVAPIGLFFGRLANFINGELFGRPTDVPWAMAFPTGGAVPRHPSQLYEAALEGLLLLAVMAALASRPAVQARPGVLFGTFLMLYGLARFTVEFFREPDPFLGFVWQGATMGQLLSLPMIGLGMGIVAYAMRKRPAAQTAAE
ncbi:prolipoprotein diacylglyceryl transferase [Caenispirillum salinarum]|uniref:prolipoprotein diacylglyceryl transferase n=1 Tax=Caenispirillum salinarum TaxID=859058 RepID=UPI00384D1815